jgi:hypothetical protein
MSASGSSNISEIVAARLGLSAPPPSSITY